MIGESGPKLLKWDFLKDNTKLPVRKNKDINASFRKFRNEHLYMEVIFPKVFDNLKKKEKEKANFFLWKKEAQVCYFAVRFWVKKKNRKKKQIVFWITMT